MGAANSKYPCIYCLIDSQHLHVTVPKQPRRIGEKGYSCVRDPIFKSIGTENVVFDKLHMYLRITDRLLKKIIQMINELDLQEIGSVSRCYAPEKMKRCAKMEDILKKAGVRGAPLAYDKDAKMVKCRDLRGPEKQKVEKVLDDIEKLVDSHAHGHVVVNAWRRFRVLYDDVRSFKKAEAMSPDRPAKLTKLKNDLVEWYDNLVDACTSKIATPYMHLFVVHAADIIERLGSIHIFNAQGLEKLNDMTTTEYFRGTNHRRGVESLVQIMRRSNRRL
ncbi:uncharacterized protein [Diadema setosum]|uniref:uncharacterized protein n=1 Tax=Diadema setosum TaxID=31175 RepID=UPI003B3BAD26